MAIIFPGQLEKIINLCLEEFTTNVYPTITDVMMELLFCYAIRL